MKKKDKEFIQNNLKHLKTTVDILNEGMQKTEWDRIQLAGMGTYLANIYTGYENIWRTILESKGIEVPKGEQWHINLLNRAKSEELIPDEMLITSKGMLGFRHLQVHGYSHTLKEENIRYFSLKAIESYPFFETYINEILEMLK
jgi:uncharacterized protein YutE (UPF0331/DUF86 family)